MRERSPRNRTRTGSDPEIAELASGLLRLSAPAKRRNDQRENYYQEFQKARHFFPPPFAELVILHPPYNLTNWMGKPSLCGESFIRIGE